VNDTQSTDDMGGSFSGCTSQVAWWWGAWPEESHHHDGINLDW